MTAHPAPPSLPYDPGDPRAVEKYSCAVTLSDMELFIFPELILALVLANSMSPLLWSWREDPWFARIGTMNDYRRVLRTKQFVMDRFAFNLDLDTWGLTTKQRELDRFGSFIPADTLARSNALFGYEGDRYYFDIDIRRHFGLDRYTDDVIPYWKTETVEAMDAFRFKPGYHGGAGECVSLAALYAAVLHIVAGIDFDRIYLMATPLHSQNFIDVRDGILTNNRRIVTRTMFFNGTELSAKARRALENEQVTVVVHNSGCIHTLYDEATIDPAVYERFSDTLRRFLQVEITFEVLTNFLRQHKRLQPCFQFAHRCCGKPRYIEAEKVYHYEHSGRVRVGDSNREQLLHDIDEDEFYPAPLPKRLLLDDVEEFFRHRSIDLDRPGDREALRRQMQHCCYDVEEIMRDLRAFCRVAPRLPSIDKRWQAGDPIIPGSGIDRAQLVSVLEQQRADRPVADLAFMALRDMARAPWKPFLKAALERNPVSIEQARNLTVGQVIGRLQAMADNSIYDATRMAQPDEVWNFGRGDGLEKALCLANILRDRFPDDVIRLEGDDATIWIEGPRGVHCRFATRKGLAPPVQTDWPAPRAS